MDADARMILLVRMRKFTYFEEWYWSKNHTLILYLSVSFAYANVLLQTSNDLSLPIPSDVANHGCSRGSSCDSCVKKTCAKIQE